MEDRNYRTALSIIIEAMAAEQRFHERVLDVGMTPPVLQNVGVPALPMTLSGKTIAKCFFDHGVTEKTLGRLYDLIASPSAVFKSDSPHLEDTTVQAIVLVTIEVKNGNPLLVAIHTNRTIGRRQVNEIKSMYDKDDGVILKWRAKSLLLWELPPQPAAVATVTPIKPGIVTAPVAAPVITVKKTRKLQKD